MEKRLKTHPLEFKFGKWSNKKSKEKISFGIDKRQKFVLGTLALSLSLFFTEFQFGKSGLYAAILLSIATNVFLFWAIYEDFRENRALPVFILPFFYSLSFGLFYFLTPTAFLSHLVLAIMYGFGLYSLFLSQNIFIVSSIRTITLLSGARIVSFVITLISFFFLTNIIYTLHVIIFPVISLLAVYTCLLVYHSLWTYSLQKNIQPLVLWTSGATICILEAATILWFWPSNPTVIALFLTGFFYTLVGISHIWFERRLFKGILWEYVWVGCIVFFVLLSFTQWGK